MAAVDQDPSGRPPVRGPEEAGPGNGNGNGNGDDLRRAVARYRARRVRWENEGEWSLARTVALMRSLGWMIALPAVLGVFAGRYLDTVSGGGVVWTIGLLALGLAIGCWMAWNRVNGD